MKITWQVVLGFAILIAVAVWYGTQRISRAEQAAIVAELKNNFQKQVNDSTLARLATSQADKKALQGLLETANELNGKLVAGLVVHVPPQNTTIDHPELPTQVIDSTRVASFKDSTVAGNIEGLITAPPCCAPLGITYNLTSPAFDPAVGFVQIGDTIAAIVQYRGQKVEIRSPYALPRPASPHRIRGFVSGYMNPFTSALEGRAGLQADVTNRWAIEAGGSTKTAAFVGVKNTFNIF